MKQHLLRAIIVLGMFAIVLIQAIWLINTYSLLKKEFTETTTRTLDKVTEIQTFDSMFQLPKDIEGVDGKSEKDKNNLPEYVYLQESLLELGVDLSMQELYEKYKTRLEESSITTPFVIYKLKADNDSVFLKTGEELTSSYTIKTVPLPIRTDYSLYIQAEFSSPYDFFLNRMGLLLFSTAGMMIFVICCIIYQIRIIAKQNKIAQLREDFSYAMIHDMKTPLSSIMMCANFLHSGKLEDKPELKEQYFKIIDNEANHLLKLADKVLTISKLESKKLDMNLESVELKPIFDNLINNFTAKATKPIEFVLSLNEEQIYADEEFIKEAFSNLIDNAMKYSKESVKIEISSERNENYAIIKFHDNGIGISEKDLKSIFNKFERASAVKRTRTGGPAGFGLGLNYVSQVVDAHGGIVLANSIEGEFSEFIVYIPLIIKSL